MTSAIDEGEWYQWIQKQAKLSRYTLWWRLGGEKVYLLLIFDLGTK
jgi:hypothetical protein